MDVPSYIFEATMIASPKTARMLVAIFLAAVLPAVACAAAAAPVAKDAAADPQKKKKTSDEKNPQAQYEMGVIALRYGLADEAVRYGQAAVALDPGHVNGWNLLGSAYYAKGEFALSAEAYGKAAEFKPEDGGVQKGLGLALAELGETAKAEAALKKSFALDGNADTAFFLGKLCHGAGRYEEALDFALQSIRADGQSPKAYNLKGVIMNQLGRHAEAVGSFQAGLVLSPEDVGLQVNLGIAYINSGDPAKARTVLEAALPKVQDEVLKKRIEDYLKAIKDDAV
jgi:tetratricopeptide (TPR) repeat protein